jgi:cysteine desulfurase family protein (TIGR01976 family)
MVDPRSSIVATGAAFPVGDIRRRFPALERAGRFIFFDNAAGAQVPSSVVDAVADHLTTRNVQRGGPYGRSREVDAMIVRARESVAAFVNARSADEIAFGLNATSFMRALSLAVGQTIDSAGAAGRSRSEIVVSELDHEANIATWLALERHGARMAWWRVRSDGRLHAADLEEVVGPRTRLVACTMASNATGSLVDVAGAARIARAAGAELFVDAVHYAPHGPIDVQAIDCDYLVCSGYKMFAPHMGFAWCRREAIAALPTFREHFIPDAMPDKLEAGTYSYESIAGIEAAVEYLHDLGSAGARGGSRAQTLRAAMTAIGAYEQTLSREFLDAVQSIPGATVHGVTDRARLGERVPTMSFTVAGVGSGAIAAALAKRDVGVRSGHMYSPRLIAQLGVPGDGVVRASLVHYNTAAEITRFRDALVEAIEDARSG